MRALIALTCVAIVVTGPAAAAPDGATRLTTLLQAYDPTFSPDGTEIAFTHDNDIWTVATSGGTPNRLSTDTEVDWGPAWSPSGDQIAFTRDWDIWVVDPVTGLETPMAATQDDEIYPTWAPSGNRIAYSRRGLGTLELWVTNLSNGNTFPAAQLAGLDILYPAWSPDGRYIAFEVRVPGEEGGIGILEVATGDVTQLVNLPTHDGQPEWAPSGAFLVFESERDAIGVTDSDIFIMPMYDGVGGTPWPISCSDQFDASPVWSPNGDTIAFMSQRDLVGLGTFDIYLLGPEVVGVETSSGSTAPPVARLSAAPNPFRAGTTIRLSTSEAAPRDVLHVMDARGRLVRELTVGASGSEVSVTWDGRDSGGLRVAPGVYFVEAAGVSSRVVHIR